MTCESTSSKSLQRRGFTCWWCGQGGCYRASSPKKIFFSILSSGIPPLSPPFLRGFVNLQSNWTKRYIRPITEKVAH